MLNSSHDIDCLAKEVHYHRLCQLEYQKRAEKLQPKYSQSQKQKTLWRERSEIYSSALEGISALKRWENPSRRSSLTSKGHLYPIDVTSKRNWRAGTFCRNILQEHLLHRTQKLNSLHNMEVLCRKDVKFQHQHIIRDKAMIGTLTRRMCMLTHQLYYLLCPRRL